MKEDRGRRLHAKQERQAKKGSPMNSDALERVVDVAVASMMKKPGVAPFLKPRETVETDPNGFDPHTPGAKLDAGKLRPGLILRDMVGAVEGVIAVGTYGAQKYTDRGWMEVPNASERYLDAALRHLLAYLGGDPNDRDTGLSHLSHAAWNLLATEQLAQNASV